MDDLTERLYELREIMRVLKPFAEERRLLDQLAALKAKNDHSLTHKKE
jgi:hypothetical protein